MYLWGDTHISGCGGRSLMMNGDTARFDATTLRLFVREINLIIKI